MIRFMKQDIVPVSILAGLLGLLLLVVAAFGQEVKTLENTKGVMATPTPAPTPSNELTQKETIFLQSLTAKIMPVQRELENIWRELLSTEDETKAINLWLKARLANNKTTSIQTEFQTWFEKVKLDHNCPTCELKDGKLVPAVAAAPVPVPASAPAPAPAQTKP